jgi:hypothetical protein
VLLVAFYLWNADDTDSLRKMLIIKDFLICYQIKLIFATVFLTGFKNLLSLLPQKTLIFTQRTQSFFDRISG